MIDRFNERWEELHAHPSQSFHGKDFPSDRELQEARRNVMRRHPRTQFVWLHVANSENLAYVAECLDSHPNMHVNIAARIGELGCQPRTAHRFFDRYQDRIVFGTDASAGTSSPQQTFGDALYQIYLPLSRNRGRILRLCARAGSTAGPLADLRPRPERGDSAEGLWR